MLHALPALDGLSVRFPTQYQEKECRRKIAPFNPDFQQLGLFGDDFNTEFLMHATFSCVEEMLISAVASFRVPPQHLFFQACAPCSAVDHFFVSFSQNK